MRLNMRDALRWSRTPTRAFSSAAVDRVTDVMTQAAVLEAVGESATTAVLAVDLTLPVLSAFPEPIEKAHRLLDAAASIEHALMIQYLYAGYAFATPNTQILGIATEEMSHFMTVQNLLRLIGKDPYFARQDFGKPESDDERLFPFDLLLEPVSKQSLAKYVVAESPITLPSYVDPALMEVIKALATAGTSGVGVNRVGSLYALLGAIFGSEQLLQEKAGSGDPWYVLVQELAVRAAAEYGGRDRLHLPDDAFLAASALAQPTDAEWDRSKVGPSDEFRVHTAESRLQALEALRDIGLQGEGPSANASESSHFARFYTLFKSLFGPDGSGPLVPAGVSHSPRGARIHVDTSSLDPNVISNALSARWAQLADCRYAFLLGTLEMYLVLKKSDRAFLQGWAFAEMFAIKKLAKFLTRMPRGAAGQPEVAAPPFSMPPWVDRAPTWQDLLQVLESASSLVAQIQVQGSLSDEQKRILTHFVSSDSGKLDELRSRKDSGLTARRKLHRIREILDWSAGAGDPQHLGSSPTIGDANQGRFWNLPLEEIRSTSVFGRNVIEIPDDGTDPLLVSMLRTGAMPRDRPPLPAESEEFQTLEAWIRNGCRDEPI